MSEHRVPMLGTSWRRHEDPAVSRDPRVRAVVGALAELPAPPMRAEFRSELRAQLVAITPRIVAESADAPMLDIVPRPSPRPRPTPRGARTKDAPVAPAARHSDSFVDRLRRLHLGRPLAVAASVITAFALLLGGAVAMSKKSLPGDTLYGLKRASERFQLATAGSDSQKARDYLNFATTRATEVRALVGRTSASGVGVHAASAADGESRAKLITSTLDSSDNDVKAAAVLVGKQAVRGSSAKPLATMTGWAPGQLERLAEIASALPTGSLRSRVVASANLVRAANARAHALAPKLGCSCLATSGSDELGPVPCSVCTEAQNPSEPQTHPAGTRHPKAPTTRSSRRDVAPGNANGSQSGAASSSAPTGTQSTPGLPLPTLPGTSLTPTLPVNVDSCGASVSLPILGGLGLNLCNGVHASTGP